jgi:hypothetical protein
MALLDRALDQFRLRRAAADRKLARLPERAGVYRTFDRTALLFDRIDVRPGPPRLNVLLPSIRPVLSAGPMTALRFSVLLAKDLGLPVRIITTDLLERRSPLALEAVKARLEAPDLEVCHVGAGAVASASPEDLWVGTWWATALALDVACKCDLIAPQSVVYLVQDYEPGFYPWSTQSAAAKSTYHAGFHHVINSAPLARYLSRQEQLPTDNRLVMGPDLDLERLDQVSQRRDGSERAVFFYARPHGRPRNLFPLGVAALQRASVLTRVPWRVILAGQPLQEPHVGRVPIEVLGQTTTDGYYDLMRRTTVALSLMMSPHPSHPPLDWAVSGGWALTNQFEDCHDGLHSRLLTAPADPESLGGALARLIEQAEPGRFVPPAPMGRPMEDVAAHLSTLL